MTLQDKIKALPKYPDREKFSPDDGEVVVLELEAALARLALARDLVAAEDMRLVAHSVECTLALFESESPCICGRDALLAALGEPK